MTTTNTQTVGVYPLDQVIRFSNLFTFSQYRSNYTDTENLGLFRGLVDIQIMAGPRPASSVVQPVQQTARPTKDITDTVKVNS